MEGLIFGILRYLTRLRSATQETYVEKNGAELTFAKTSGTITGDREKTSQQLTGASPVTIPETIAGRISRLQSSPRS